MQHRRQAEKTQLFLQPLGIEFAADFYQNFFVFLPLKCAVELRKTNLVALVGNGVHFDLLPIAIESGFVAHLGKIEIAFEQAIDVAKDVKNKLGGDAAAVVVRVLQDIDRLYAVRAKQKKIVRPHGGGQGAEETRKVGVVEIADGAADRKSVV